MVALEKIKNFLAPLPVILVTTRLRKSDRNIDNIIPLSWVGTIDFNPHLININISKGKYSGNVIRETKQFGVCIPTSKHLKQVDICGCTHGDKVDKFKLVNFSKLESEEINVPLIKECPIRMECKLEKIIPFGTHEMFVGKIVKTHIGDKYILECNEPDFGKIDILCYVNDEYWTLDKKLENLFFTKKK
ncbi:hypothetical protein ES702_02237 [subsurface metagenome]